MKADEVVDARGLLCPMPIVKLSQKIKTLEAGRVLELDADDEGAKADIPAWCSKTGNEYLGMEDAGGFYRFFVRKTT